MLSFLSFRDFLPVALGAARCIPIGIMLPAFGGPALPLYVRFGLGMVLLISSLPLLFGHPVGGGFPHVVGLFLRELLVGAAMGYVVSLAFKAVEVAGRVSDILRGANALEINLPLSGERSSPMGALLLLLAIVIFNRVGGIPYLSLCLYKSYQALPLAGGIGPAVTTARWFGIFVLASGKMLAACVMLAAPVLIYTVMADMVFFFYGKINAHIPVHFVAMPVRALAGIFALLVALPSIATAIVDLLRTFLGMVYHLFG
jgi:flagellar biosynthetic protein FliR